MIFTDPRFVLLVLIGWGLFFAVPPRHRPLVLAGSGVTFYATFAGRHLPLIMALMVGTFLATKGRALWILVGAIALLFAGFKLGLDMTWLRTGGTLPSAISVPIVPLGFSFLSFELLHFAIDRRAGRITSAPVLEYAAFAFFFPCRVAGPIKRFPQFVEAVRTAEPSFVNVCSGLVRILVGLAKKTVLADTLGLTVAEISHATTPFQVWRVVLAYSLQIYLDFSGYSDIAIGTSRLFGIAIPENFHAPYLSSSVQEFWTRWHISLSSWARDYIFAPLGRGLFRTRLRRFPDLVATLSCLATFLFIGAWHGLTPNYLAWGAYHGLLVAGYLVYRRRVPLTVATSRLYQSRYADIVGALMTFFLVTVGWVPFITKDLQHTLTTIRMMFGLS